MIPPPVLTLLRRGVRRLAIHNLKKRPQLWQELLTYRQKSKSTGCSYSDYWELYRTVRLRKPKEILECGPGFTTLIQAYALMENAKEGFPGRITAMEELDSYLQMAVDLLPGYLHSYVEFCLSPRVEDGYALFRGVRYRDVPSRPFDMVFVDGPDLYAPSDGALTFDFDYINVVKRSEIPVYAIVDYRLSTSFALQVLFGKKKVKFNAVRELAYVGPCTKNDLPVITLESLTDAFIRNARLLGSTEITLR